MGLVLAIDAGTTNLKVGLVDAAGRLVSSDSCAMRVHSGTNGSSEQNPDELWDAVVALSRRVLSGREPDCVVLSTYQFGWLAVDEGMRPLGGISLLSDIRARETFGEFLEEFDAEELYQRTGCPALFQYALARCFYFKKCEPEMWRRAAKFIGSKDFLIWKLTGEFVAEQSVAAATQMKCLYEPKWDGELLQRVGLKESQLPRLVSGTQKAIPLCEQAAKALGVRKGVPVLPGYYDAGALVVGMGGLRGGLGVINAGTSAMLRVAGDAPLLDGSVERRLQPYALESNLFVNGGGVNNAGLAIEWWRGKISDGDLSKKDFSELQKAAAGLFALPYLTGERDALVGADASGALVGLRTSHDADALQYALLESVAFSLRMIRDSLATGGKAPTVFAMSGGCTKLKLFNRLISSGLNSPLKIMSHGEAGLVGCGVLGLVHLGLGSLDEFSKRAAEDVSNEYLPEEDMVVRLDEKFTRFRRVLVEFPKVFRASQ